MNRPIKFRIWDKRRKAYLKDPTILNGLAPDCGGRGVYSSFEDTFTDDRWLLEQYIGLQDKEGKEIYEGDIIRDYDGDGVHTVEYFEDCFCLCRMSWGEGRDMKKRSPHSREWWDTLRVIGNIHEHPEMLDLYHGQDPQP